MFSVGPRFLLFAALLSWLSSAGVIAQAYAPEGSFLVSVYDAKALGTATATWCATQDADGVLYFGGSKLFVTDGERWRTYPMGISNAVRSLQFAPDGRLWAAGTNELGWFERSPIGDWNYHSLRPQLPADIQQNLGEVWNVYATDQGAIYVSDRHIMIWNGSRFDWWQYDVSRRLVSARYHDEVYVYHRASGLLRVDPAGPALSLPPSVVGPDAVFWMGDINHQLIYVTNGGVGVITDGHLQFPDQTLGPYLKKNILTCVQGLPDGSLAIGTLRGGIVLVGSDLRVQRMLTVESGLPTDEIYGLFVARDGAVWATANTQFFRVNTLSGVTTFNLDNGLPLAGSIDATLYQDRLTVLTPDGLWQLQPGADRTASFIRISEFSGGCNDIEPTPEGLLVGSIYGVHEFRDGKAHKIYKTPADVFKIQPTEKPGVFNAVDGRKIVQFSTTGAAARDLTLPLPDIGGGFFQDATGRLWIGTGLKGLWVARPTEQGPVPAEPAHLQYGFPAVEGHTQIVRLEHSFVGIGPEGAHWLNPATERFEPVRHFPAGTATAISNADAQGRVWVALEGEQAGLPPRIGLLTRTKTDVEWQPRSIEGLAAAGVPRALHVQNTKAGDVLWIAGNRAVLRAVHPERMLATPPSSPLLRALARGADGAETKPVAGVLPYATRRLYLQFSSTEHGRRDTLRYQTLLEGVDQDWSAPSNAAELSLTNLREGRYTFKVRLLADTGEVSPPTVLNFGIAPPWWRTPYAYGGYIAALALTLAGVYQLRMRAVRQRSRVLEATVRERTQELEKANAAKTEFVASMSHEIRNPMNGIIGSASALADTPLNDEQRELVSTLRNCATFLASLVEDVLDFSAIEAGAFTVQRQPCNAAEILRTVAEMLSAPAVVAGAHFEIEVDPALPERFLGDPARIQQIVVNYATNALKFSGGGRVRLSAYTDNGCAAFAVTDDGPGISTEDQAVLFTRFSRLKTARIAGVPGAGLGLAVCRAVAESMQGTVGVASAPGRGATFFMRIPLKTAPRETPSDLPVLPSMAGARALVVEDLDYNARALGAMLRKLGFTVDLARQGEEALRLLAAGSYRAVFLDYDLPDMSGLEVVRRLRAREAGLTHTLVIATTAYSTVEDRNACLAAGMDAFLGKPITPDKLQAALSSMPSLALPAPSMQLPVEADVAVNLSMLAYLADNEPGALQREIGRYLDSLQTVHREVTAALQTRDRPVLGRAAHRMLSHARMVDAAELAAAAIDLQDNADYVDEIELDRMGAEVAAAVANLRKTLTSRRATQASA